MNTTPAALPGNPEELRALLSLQAEAHAKEVAKFEQRASTYDDEIAKHEQKASQYDDEISQLHEYIRMLKSKRFGVSSERSAPGQMGLFNEAEVLCDEDESEQSERASIDVPAHTRRKRGGRKPLPDFLPREEIVHDLTDDQKVCRNDPSHVLTEIGRDKLEQLAFIPATAKVIVHVRPKYACAKCKDGVHTAAMPAQPIPKSLATPSLLAQIAVSKYVDGAPLNRQEAMFRRMGIDISRGNMAFWMIKMGELTQPLVDCILEGIRAHDYVLADETPFQVLKENGKRATSKSYLWALLGGDASRPLLYYEYSPTRSGEVVNRLLAGFKGYLQTDGYAGYDAIGRHADVVHVACFAHARRKFDEALRGHGKGGKKRSGGKQSLARQGLSKINKLYEYERQWRDATPQDRYEFRQEKMKPKLEALRQWLDESIDRVTPTSLTGKAMKYLDGQWHKLVRVLDDGRIALDTNAVERCIRPFVLGRKAWLFADTPKGAKASANLYSLVETAKANGLEPWRYLNAVFERLPLAKSAEDIEALLPWRIAVEEPSSDVTRLPAR